jgi:hypothetical protein
VVVGFRNAEVDRTLAALGPDSPPIIDLVGVDAALRERGRYEGVCW